MGMWTTDNQDTMKIVLKAFNDAAYKNYGSHSFAAGYLESLVVSMLPSLPKRVQKVFIEDMVRATQKQEQAILDRLIKETA
jgi:hypothetical protein